MDVIRRNTDYALRLMIRLAGARDGDSISTRVLAQEQGVSYQLACKLMQQLHEAELVESCMGPKGGFRLGREPGAISLLDVIEVIQGPVRLNRCVLREAVCPRQNQCPVRRKIGDLQSRMEEYLGAVTLEKLTRGRGTRPGTNRGKLKEE